jgi:hypothetical protein
MYQQAVIGLTYVRFILSLFDIDLEYNLDYDDLGVPR